MPEPVTLPPPEPKTESKAEPVSLPPVVETKDVLPTNIANPDPQMMMAALAMLETKERGTPRHSRRSKRSKRRKHDSDTEDSADEEEQETLHVIYSERLKELEEEFGLPQSKGLDKMSVKRLRGRINARLALVNRDATKGLELPMLHLLLQGGERLAGSFNLNLRQPASLADTMCQRPQTKRAVKQLALLGGLTEKIAGPWSSLLLGLVGSAAQVGTFNARTDTIEGSLAGEREPPVMASEEPSVASEAPASSLPPDEDPRVLRARKLMTKA